MNRSYKAGSLSMPSAENATADGLVQSSDNNEARASNGGADAAGALKVIAPVAIPAAQALQNFYGALAELGAGKRSQPVSILHLGGDQIVDDKFAAPLRESLTGRFGNAGRGLMQPGLYPLRGVKVDRGGQWALSSAAAESPGPFGITGARVTSDASDAWLRFTSVEGTFAWVEVTLLTGPQQGTAAVSIDGDVKLVPTRSPVTANTSIRIAAKAREIMIRPKGDGAISVLSVASGTQYPGILYSNAGLPGATALTLEKWDAGLAANDFQKLPPDLVILNYGAREGFLDGLDAADYEARVKSVIAGIKRLAPQASILIVGPADAARIPGFAGSEGAQACRSLNAQEIATYSKLLERRDGRLARWHAPPRLDAVRMALRRQAAQSGAYFWDWAKYMGGACSIHAWAGLKPPLAAPDHLTLTEAGNERSARALFAELIAGFESYQSPKDRVPVAAAFTAEIQPAKPKKGGH